MTNNHVDEYSVQKYVLQKINCDEEIIEHIEHCDTCKIKAEQYKVLFKGIKQQEKPVFDFNLSQLVLAQIIKPTPTYSLAMVIVYLLVFVSFIPFVMVFYQFRISILYIFAGPSAFIVSVIFVSILFILIFQNIEFYKKYKQKMDALNFY